MKDFKDLKKVQEGKYTVFSGESKNDKIKIIIMDYNYGDSQFFISLNDDNFIEIPFGLSGSFTSRNGEPYNSMSLTLDDYFQKRLNLTKGEIQLFVDGYNCLISYSFRKFAFLKKDWQVSQGLYNLQYEECPVIETIESQYKFSNNLIEIKSVEYKSTYDDYKFIFNGEEWKILEFLRYRDGGTTDIKLEDKHGNIHQFHSDTPFKGENREIYLILNGLKVNLA